MYSAALTGDIRCLRLYQTLYVDAFELLPKEPLSAEEVAPTGDRYEDVTTIFGRTAMTALRNKRTFLVGAGALGCELLKVCAPAIHSHVCV